MPVGSIAAARRRSGGGGAGIAFAAYSHTSNSITPNYPASIAAGDILIGVVIARVNDSTLDYTPPSGFQRLTVARATDTHVFVFYKVAAGTESGTATFTKNATAINEDAAFILRFTGATKIEDLRVFTTTSSTANAISSPAITTTVANSLVCNLIATGGTTTVAPEAGWTESFEDGTNNVGTGSDYSLALHHIAAPTIGVQTTEEPTPSGDSHFIVVSFALAPSGTTAAQSLTVRGSRAIHVNNVSSVGFTLPTGSQAGDRCVISAGHGFGVNTPTDWFSLNNLTGTNFNGAVFEKILTPADITAGSVTITFAGAYYGAIGGVTFVGCTGGYRTFTASRNSTNTSPRTVTTDSSPVSGDYGVFFGSHRRTTGTVTIDKGSSLQTVSNTEGSAALYGGALGSSGAVAANFTYSPTGSGDYQSVVIVQAAGA